VLTLIKVSFISSYDKVVKFAAAIVIVPLAPTTRDFTGDGEVYPARFLRQSQKKYVPAEMLPPDVVVMVGTESVRLAA